MTTTNLTEAQFSVAQDAIDAVSRKVRKGTAEEKAAHQVLTAEWEAAIMLPVRTFDQRAARLAAIAAVATKYGLVK